jgi:hypothetical protein
VRPAGSVHVRPARSISCHVRSRAACGVWSIGRRISLPRRKNKLPTGQGLLQDAEARAERGLRLPPLNRDHLCRSPHGEVAGHHAPPHIWLASCLFQVSCVLRFVAVYSCPRSSPAGQPARKLTRQRRTLSPTRERSMAGTYEYSPDWPFPFA